MLHTARVTFQRMIQHNRQLASLNLGGAKERLTLARKLCLCFRQHDLGPVWSFTKCSEELAKILQSNCDRSIFKHLTATSCLNVAPFFKLSLLTLGFKRWWTISILVLTYIYYKGSAYDVATSICLEFQKVTFRKDFKGAGKLQNNFKQRVHHWILSSMFWCGGNYSKAKWLQNDQTRILKTVACVLGCFCLAARRQTGTSFSKIKLGLTFYELSWLPVMS